MGIRDYAESQDWTVIRVKPIIRAGEAFSYYEGRENAAINTWRRAATKAISRKTVCAVHISHLRSFEIELATD
jgi:hypothetical protein